MCVNRRIIFLSKKYLRQGKLAIVNDSKLGEGIPHDQRKKFKPDGRQKTSYNRGETKKDSAPKACDL